MLAPSSGSHAQRAMAIAGFAKALWAVLLVRPRDLGNNDFQDAANTAFVAFVRVPQGFGARHGLRRDR